MSYLSLTEFATRLSTQLGASIHVGTSRSLEYPTEVPAKLPGVWVLGQALSAMDSGAGGSNRYEQRCRVEVSVLVAVKHFVDGQTDNETGLATLFNSVANALKDWTPTGAEKPLAWASARDGQPTETVLTALLTFFTHVRYSRTP
jgi:hypothetical protein